MDVYVQITFRVIAIMALFLVCTLISGRRHLSELPVFDFLVIITLGSIVGADIAEPDIPHLPVAYSIILITIIQFFYGKIILKNRKIGRLLTFEPIVVIQNGEFIKPNLDKINYSIDTILTLLREKDIFYLNEIDFAVIESTGNISVLKKTKFDNVTKEDMNISGTYKGIPLTVIIEGKVCESNLSALNLDITWLNDNLSIQNIHSISEVFYACVDKANNLYATKTLTSTLPINDIKH